MFQLKKVYHAFQNTSPKSSTKNPKSVSIPLHQLSILTNLEVDYEVAQKGPILPADIWLMILPQVNYTEDCILCKHKELYTLSLVCRVFNVFATKALYRTLDLRVEDGCLHEHQDALDAYLRHPSFLKESVLRKKLDRLENTLRLPEGPALSIRHLKLPKIELHSLMFPSRNDCDPRLYFGLPRGVYNYGKDTPSAHYKHKSAQDNPPLYMRPLVSETDLAVWKKDISTGILPKWITIFELASSRLESVSGLGILWTYIYEYERVILRERLCDAIEKNLNWTEWDWRWGSWGFSHECAIAITQEPRLLEIFHRMKNIRSIKLDNAEWATKVLEVLPGSLDSVKIDSLKANSDVFSTIFQYLPLEGLQSLRIIASVAYFIPLNKNNPFTSLIGYLKRCHQQSTSTFTNLDLQVDWNLASFSPHIYSVFQPLPMHMISLEELFCSIFTYAPLLRTFNLVLSTPHEDEIQYFITKSHPTSFTAHNLHTMNISLPARNSKTWLASKISSNSFPALRTFSFRSAFSRNNGPKQTCARCTCESWAEVEKWYDFAGDQDKVLVEACQQARIREWEMEILNLPWAQCSSFTLEESLEDDPASLYFRPPQNLTDHDAGLFFSGLPAHVWPRTNSARRNVRVVESSSTNLNPTQGTVCDIFASTVGRGCHQHPNPSIWIARIPPSRVGQAELMGETERVSWDSYFRDRGPLFFVSGLILAPFIYRYMQLHSHLSQQQQSGNKESESLGKTGWLGSGYLELNGSRGMRHAGFVIDSSKGLKRIKFSGIPY